jgi:hypothetical protein
MQPNCQWWIYWPLYTCYLLYDPTVKVSAFVTSYEENPLQSQWKKITFGAASEDAKAICSQLRFKRSQLINTQSQVLLIRGGSVSKTTRRRFILYLPSRKVGNLFDNYTVVPRSWNFKKILSAQQTQVYLRLSWGSVHPYYSNIDLSGLTWALLCVPILCIEARGLRSASGDRSSSYIHVHRMTKNFS